MRVQGVQEGGYRCGHGGIRVRRGGGQSRSECSTFRPRREPRLYHVMALLPGKAEPEQLGMASRLSPALQVHRTCSCSSCTPSSPLTTLCNMLILDESPAESRILRPAVLAPTLASPTPQCASLDVLLPRPGET